jgi:hypothetical protein
MKASNLEDQLVRNNQICMGDIHVARHFIIFLQLYLCDCIFNAPKFFLLEPKRRGRGGEKLGPLLLFNPL